MRLLHAPLRNDLRDFDGSSLNLWHWYGHGASPHPVLWDEIHDPVCSHGSSVFHQSDSVSSPKDTSPMSAQTSTSLVEVVRRSASCVGDGVKGQHGFPGSPRLFAQSAFGEGFESFSLIGADGM